jgi:chemotaxis protein CheD
METSGTMPAKHTIGISDMKFSNNPGDVLVTHALGSCIGIAIYDPVHVVGGMIHYMLPMSSIDKDKAAKNPLMFGDTGIPLLFQEIYKYGSIKSDLRIVMAGGANIFQNTEFFDIGNRNITIARKLFWKNNVMISAENIGGNIPRTLYLEIGSGRAWFTSNSTSYEL